MGTYDLTVWTAACDVEGCVEIYGDEDDLGWNWSAWSSDCEDDAIRGGWTKTGDVLICKAEDDAHETARGRWPDARPKPGPGQLALALA